MTLPTDWKAYEELVRGEFAALHPDAVVTANVKLPGLLSRTDRQIDVLIEESLGGVGVKTAVDAKLYGRPLDVKNVEEFIGMLGDIGVERGVIVTKTGYSEAALARAFAADVDLDLDVLALADLAVWQSRIGIPFAGRHAVVLPAPFGWAVDARTGRDFLARFYRRGLSADQAEDRWEWMYVNLWNRDHAVHSLDLLLDAQAAAIQTHADGRAVIVQSEMNLRNDARSVLRRADLPQYQAAELTGFIEFPEFICFITLFTPLYVERRNTRKLAYMIRKAQMAKIEPAA